MGSWTSLCQSLLCTVKSRGSGSDPRFRLGEESSSGSRGSKGRGSRTSPRDCGKEAASPLESRRSPGHLLGATAPLLALVCRGPRAVRVPPRAGPVGLLLNRPLLARRLIQSPFRLRAGLGRRATAGRGPVRPLLSRTGRPAPSRPPSQGRSRGPSGLSHAAELRSTGGWGVGCRDVSSLVTRC